MSAGDDLLVAMIYRVRRALARGYIQASLQERRARSHTDKDLSAMAALDRLEHTIMTLSHLGTQYLTPNP